MSLPVKSYSSANFYRFAAICAACFVVAQIIQEFAFHHGISDSPVGEQVILQRLMPLDQFRPLLRRILQLSALVREWDSAREVAFTGSADKKIR